jgi:predicted AlkP superfamily phosphohydrolase/phosphomutase
MLRKTLVLSIDSGCWTYLEPLLSAGRMPTVAQLIEGGVRGVLESTMPPITPVAFSSFITGTNPGKHGIFGWTVRHADGGSQPVSAALRQGVPFWHYLNQAGVRVGLFNVPITYPPQPLDGFLVPGIAVPRDTRSLTYPAEVLHQIEDRYGPYEVDVPQRLLDRGIDIYSAAWLKYEEMQTDAALMLMNECDVDVLAFNYASLDRLNHISPRWEDLEATLTNIDAQIGRLVERYPEANFILMSDHGSRRVKSAFLLGKWLVQNGYALYGEKSLDIPRHEINFALARYLQAHGMNGTGEQVLRNLLRGLLTVVPSALRRPVWGAMYRAVPEALGYRFTERLDWDRTKVFATSNSGALFINMDGRSPGTVTMGGYEALRDTLIRDLLTVRDPVARGKVFSNVYRREELYHGPAVAQAPDVIADHYDSTCDLIVDNNPRSFCFVNRLNRFGDHTREGIFVLSGPDFVWTDGRAHRASITDLPATLLHLYGVSIPDDFDGRVLGEFLAVEFMAQHPIHAQAASEDSTGPQQEYSDREMEQMTEHLRELGYL